MSWIALKKRSQSKNAKFLLVAVLATYLLPVSAKPPAGASGNALLGNPSPYLAMHGRDPVHWQPWGHEAVKRARAEGKLLFVSSGYFSCHWCHVMQRESYQDAAVAALLNEKFVPVKIDRELLPALDDYLISFTEETTGQAGWPLNVFLTPEGHPLFGMTYAPKENFLTLLGRLQELWEKDRQDLSLTAKQAADMLQNKAARQLPDPPYKTPSEWAGALQDEALPLMDELAGGFGQQNKFPMLPQLQALLQSLHYKDNARLREFLELTLDSMAKQGLRDLLRGGFFRYTVDPSWQTPHFEKMLYTNALIVPLYIEAADVLARPDFKNVAIDTLSFVLTDMRHPQGGYVASLSAVDDQNVEGGYYTWSSDDLAKLSSDLDRQLLKLVWGLGADAPTVEGGQLPVSRKTLAQVAESLGLMPDSARESLVLAKAQLKRMQFARVLPVDTKVLTAWNALLLKALVSAAELPDSGQFDGAADDLYLYIRDRLWDGERLHRDRSGSIKASLSDYAYTAEAIAVYAAWRKNQSAEKLSRKIARKGWSEFYSLAGWRRGDSQFIELPASFALSDGALPSESAIMIEASLDPIGLGKDLRLQRYAMNAQLLAQAQTGAGAFWMATHLRGFFRKLEK